MAGALVCPNGHEIVEPDAVFCDSCGATLVATAPAGAALLALTRRQALFAAIGTLVLVSVAVLAVCSATGGDSGGGGVRGNSGLTTTTKAPGSTDSATPASATPEGTPSPGAESQITTTATEGAAGQTAASGGASPTATPRPPTVAPTATPAPPAPAPPPTYTNLVGNGGFETGSLSAPWGTGIYEPRAEVFWGSADADAVVVSDSVHGGQYALRITNRSAQAAQIYRTLAQKVAVKGGQRYCLTWWARTVNARNGIMNFRMNDAWTIVLSIGGGLPEYTQYAGTFTAEDNNIDLRIVSENTGTVWVDDIEMSEGACKVPNGTIPGGASPR